MITVDELFKILLTDKPSTIILENEEEIFNLIPELRKCKGFNQHSKWHPYDVYEHILHVIDYTPNNLVLRVAALFHDIAKPETFILDEEGRGHFPKHEIHSLEIFKKFASKEEIDKDLRDRVCSLIYFHDINFSKFDEEYFNKFSEEFSKEEIKQLFELKKADLLAQSEKYHYMLEDYDKQEKQLLKNK